MIQSFKEAQVKTSLPWEIFLDNFLLKYRSTPHATTGVSPAELLFKRRLRIRLDLLFPKEQLGYRVSSKQQVQKFTRTASRSLNLNEGNPVMVRNYTPGAKGLPASVEKQTGPLSYKCELGDGRNIKRHQDQIISTDSQLARVGKPLFWKLCRLLRLHQSLFLKTLWSLLQTFFLPRQVGNLII